MSPNSYKNITEYKTEHIDLKSDEVREIMGQIPNRLIRYGIVIIAVIISALVVFSFVFRYPEVINGSFYLQTSNPPAFLLSKSSGKMQNLFVADGDSVKSGELLAIVESPVSSEGYKLLRGFISLGVDSILEKEQEQKWEIISKESQLGELQSPFSEVVKYVSEYQTLKRIDYFQEKRKAVKERMRRLRRRRSLLIQQINSAQKAFEIDRKVLTRDSLLFASNVIAEADYENARKGFISQERELIDTRLNLSSVELNLSELDQELLDINLSEQQSIDEHLSAIKIAFNHLKASLSEWENRFCLVSPINGVVALSGVWEENQNVESGQMVMAVLPQKATKLIGKLSIPVRSAGKVHQGQEVNLKFVDFPSHEFGLVVTNLEGLSEVPDSAYVGTVLLPDTLVTNYGKQLPFKQNMQGVAEIITEDISLAERLVYPLKAILKENME
ncbi:HlyD family efflux transporter periplasmic adaptor subunit [Marinilabilia sp.]|uniref:HlyD family efflux transporter periplasmic adaptor subunit n=1 Tax=Marinilabilia sp. TaxID=2021252 RepID=UPI0025C2BA71|nr:HlyD family efflux transporter periplasmic adaptor subunit [Marinilabilia sp.]